MKINSLLFSLLAVGLLALGGCKKADSTNEQAFHGINVDWPKVDTEFIAADAEVQQSLTDVKRSLRYAQFPDALMALDKIVNSSNLTDPQKKLVNDLIEQTKKAITAQPAPGQ